MFKKKSQSGRSMVEMLGVLAVIGVLSIGGIAGYTIAMRRHRGNQILDLANKYSAIIYAACENGISNGTIQPSEVGYYSCGYENMPRYSDSGLSPIADATFGVGGVNRKTGEVTTTVYFKDVTMCKTVKSMLGRNNSIDCVYYNELDIRFKHI